MPASPRRTPGQRAGLTREAVLHQARAVLAAEGADKLTMRRLAQALGVAPNALYSHVAGKAELLDALLDDTLARVTPPDPRRVEWRTGLETMMRRTYDVLLEHPDLVPLYLARRGARGPNAVALGEVMLELLARGGIEGDAAQQRVRVLIVYTIGFAAFTVQGQAGPGVPEREDGSVAPKALEANFRQGLRWLVEGLA